MLCLRECCEPLAPALKKRDIATKSRASRVWLAPQWAGRPFFQKRLLGELATYQAAAQHVERVDAFNARRGDLPFIVDAETRIRSIPGKVTPAIKETRKVWVGTDGKPCSEYTVDAEGRQVRRQGVHEEIREFVIRGELPAVATMPTRFADALVLVDIAGRSL